MNLIIFFILIFCSSVSADQKIFYLKDKNSYVYDVSGEKTEEQIKKEFNSDDVVETTVKSNESATFKNNKLEKYDFVKKNKDLEEEKKQSMESKEQSIKTKLNLTDKEFDDLKDIINGK